VSAAVAGLPASSLVTLRLPVRSPVAVGLNVTFTVQDAPTASVPTQVPVWPKSPLAVTAEVVAALVPGVVTVACCAAPVLRTSVPGNASVDGARVRCGPGAMPVPESGTVLATPAAVTVRLPVLVPAALGLNLTLTVQDAPAPIELPQVLVWLKSPV